VSRRPRRSRWRVAALGALVVVAVLATLSAGAYTLARRSVYGQLQDRLERAARHGFVEREGEDVYVIIDERGRRLTASPVPGELDGDGRAFRIVSDPALGPLAVLSRPTGLPGPRVVATPAEDAVRALSAFLRTLLALTLAGGLAALPAGYVLAGIALRPLDEAVRERNDFIALASHQLRTPLAVIRTSAELARDGRGMAPDEALETILGQTERMEALASRLTALARAEMAVPSAGDRADLRAAAREVVSLLLPAAEAARVRLSLEAGEPLWVRADPDELKDLLSVLVENAIRFSPEGTPVRVLVRREGASAVLEVTDQGPGIPPEEIPRVLEPFVQGRNARGGFGLGLAIARTIAERRRGRLAIRSQPGRGTTVRVTFPLRP
jgi:signal transduction histidine kinase